MVEIRQWESRIYIVPLQRKRNIVSLIGTFAFMYAYGFSLNLLTLFALVLVIGTVVESYS